MVFVSSLGADEISPTDIQGENVLGQQAAEPLVVDAAARLLIDDMALTTMRENDILDQPVAKPLATQEQSPNRRIRDHPVQAPTIPHAIKGYPINKEINQCLACHDRNVAPLVKAPTIAVSHFQNRDGDYLANVSPRRYFCTQCHVVQTVTD